MIHRIETRSLIPKVNSLEHWICGMRRHVHWSHCIWKIPVNMVFTVGFPNAFGTVDFPKGMHFPNMGQIITVSWTQVSKKQLMQCRTRYHPRFLLVAYLNTLKHLSFLHTQTGLLQTHHGGPPSTSFHQGFRRPEFS